jgi:hypothetical protein
MSAEEVQAAADLWTRDRLDVLLPALPEAWRQTYDGPDAWGAIPEVGAALRRHLDPVVEPSPLVRAAYGETLGALALIGRSWVTQDLEALLPADPGLAHLREATWGAYLIANHPSRSLFPVLRPAYQRAVEALSSPETLNGGRETPSHHLALRLIALYWSGDIGLDDPLLTTLYERADAGPLGTAMEAVAHSLCEPDAVDAATLQRLSSLLEWRVTQRQLSSSGSDAKGELQWYGGWVASRKLPEEWALQRLGEVLALTGGRATPDWQVAEALPEMAPRRAAPPRP